jgi:hypothetical protein
VFTASPVNVVKSTLDKLGIPLRPGSRAPPAHQAEHSINLGHCIQFQDTSIPVIISGCKEHIFRELIKTELCHYNVNREASLANPERMKEGPLL